MDRISELKPQSVFHYFEAISRIPRGSGNMAAISDYLAEFARQRGLEYIQDETKNVLIFKEATAGYEEEEPIILQGHMDMVAVKRADCAKDMAREGLDLKVEGDELYADGTSLGGDDGIAVAYALALLDAEDIPHPRLEVVLTVNEETGMDGAFAVDLTCLRGKRLLNIDNEEEGALLTGCAGGTTVHGRLAIETEGRTGYPVFVRIQGLTGGHSGVEIDKGRANANVLLGRLIYQCLEQTDCDTRLVILEGGDAGNAIASSSEAVLFVPGTDSSAKENAEAVCAVAHALERTLRKKYALSDPGLRITAMTLGMETRPVMTAACTRRAVRILYLAPNGVQRMSSDIPGLVQTSLNLGVVRTRADEVIFDYSVRSSIESEKELTVSRVCELLRLNDAIAETSTNYPAWEYRRVSPFRDKLKRIYEEMYGAPPRLETIHAGVECGILSSKIPDMDAISIGPDMKNIHTPGERLSISSVQRVWEFILRVLSDREGSEENG